MASAPRITFHVRRHDGRWRVSPSNGGAALDFDELDEAKRAAVGACELIWRSQQMPYAVSLELTDQQAQVVAAFGATS